jgi:excisionase family DNA binding protein
MKIVSNQHSIAQNEPNRSLDPLLTVKEGAAVLRISVPTFWRRVADGTISNPVKLGGLSRWPESEIHEVIERAKDARVPN